MTGVQKLQQYRFAVFHDWTKNSLAHCRNQLQDGERRLGDVVRLSLRRPSAILGPACEAVLGTDEDFYNDEGGPVSGFLAEWIAGPHNTVAGFLSSVIPAVLADGWEERWEWDGQSWFLRRLCSRRPWAVLKCPVCFSELFWSILAGAPLRACPGCGFNNGGVDFDAVLASYAKWAGEFARQEPTLGDWKSFDAESIELYSRACERHIDAVTGVKLPVQPRTFLVMEQIALGYHPGNHWFMQRGDYTASDAGTNLDICCSQCAWAGNWIILNSDDLRPACPSCGYGSSPAEVREGQMRANRKEPSQLSDRPEEFMQSLVGAIVSLKNNPHVRDGINAIDPDAPGAAEDYAKVFLWALPSAPPLSREDMMVIAKEIKQRVKFNGQPLAVPDTEVFAFLSSIFGQA